jgi:hypothetical protein
MTTALRDARDGLRAAALTLSREVEMNRQILRNALSTGSELIRGLYPAPETTPTYALHAVGGDSDRAGGLLINRQI